MIGQPAKKEKNSAYRKGSYVELATLKHHRTALVELLRSRVITTHLQMMVDTQTPQSTLQSSTEYHLQQTPSVIMSLT